MFSFLLFFLDGTYFEFYNLSDREVLYKKFEKLDYKVFNNEFNDFKSKILSDNSLKK